MIVYVVEVSDARGWVWDTCLFAEDAYPLAVQWAESKAPLEVTAEGSYPDETVRDDPRLRPCYRRAWRDGMVEIYRRDVVGA